MDSMRDLLRRNLGRSLEKLPELGRLTAAWPVACGTAMAAKGDVVGYEDGILQVVVKNSVWLEQMRSMQHVLERELARIAEVKLTGIHFEVKRLGGRKPGPKASLERV